MKLKYYLRGLGIGIVVTAVIMSLIKKPEVMTDAQIKMRALELGMVEKNVLSDFEEDSKNEEENLDGSLDEGAESEATMESEEATESESALEGEEAIESESALEGEETIETDSSLKAEDVEEPNENSETEQGAGFQEEVEVVENYIIISVDKGNGSEIVSKKMFEAGLVNSATQFNQYLVRNSYDRKLKVGNHEIPVGATEEEMAKILCGIR